MTIPNRDPPLPAFAPREALRDRARAFQASHPPAPKRPPPEDHGERLATVPRGEGVELRVAWCLYEGKPYVSVRQWERSGDGSYWPTKGKGITVKVRELGAVVEALVTAMDKADERP